ncbi:MAG TPA: hypothetical protein VNT55_08275 [Baekduia sp.]|nr:hypothetical protein [Baekduia sp.]
MTAVRGRVAVFAGLVLVCVVGVVVVVAGLGGGDGAVKASAGAATALPDAKAAGRSVVLFRAQGHGAAADGQLELAPVSTPSGTPTELPLKCDRSYFAADAGICLRRGHGFAAGYEAAVFGPDLKVRHRLAVQGVPSRARVSPDGRYGSVTLFVTGHSYAAAGQFSTNTVLIDMATGREIASLEDFAVSKDDQQMTAVDNNFWGVTFDPRDSDTFYATIATGGHTYLFRGSVKDRTGTVLHENVECPSLSPDGTRIAYKKRTGSTSKPWHLTVLDLKTLRETPLAEPRSIDDQVEWLDDRRVLYGAGDAVYAAAADGSGAPARYLSGAGSPSVQRWGATPAANAGT